MGGLRLAMGGLRLAMGRLRLDGRRVTGFETGGTEVGRGGTEFETEEVQISERAGVLRARAVTDLLSLVLVHSTDATQEEEARECGRKDDGQETRAVQGQSTPLLCLYLIWSASC